MFWLIMFLSFTNSLGFTYSGSLIRPLTIQYDNAIIDVPVKTPEIILCSGRFPSELYNELSQKLGEIGKVTRCSSQTLPDYLSKLSDDEQVCIVAHSIGANDALRNAKKNEKTKIVLIDPIDYNSQTDNSIFEFDLEALEENISSFIEADKFKLLLDSVLGRNNRPSSNIPNKVTIIKSKLSNRWRIFPPIPPIAKYALNVDHLKNKTIVDVEGFGHFDVMDPTWANIMNQLSKGANDRNTIYQYHDQIANIITDFIYNEHLVHIE